MPEVEPPVPTESAAAPGAVLDDAPPEPVSWRSHAWLAGNLVAVVLIVVFSVIYGLQLRRWAWDKSEQIHFRNSLNNAISWGQYTNQFGKLEVYKKLVETDGEEGRFTAVKDKVALNYPHLPLDYPPLRLMIIAKWEAWTEKHFPQKHPWDERWQSVYEFTAPMLWLNTACEMGASVGMFLLVHFWLRQCSGAPARQWARPLIGLWPALFAALLVWFSPAVIYNAHCYPQWDVWILPAFLFAVYLGMLDQWLIAGVCIGIVALGKGQILLVTPALILWQLMIGRFGAVIRLLIGIGLAVAVIASPWMVLGDIANHWVWCALISLLMTVVFFFYRKWTRDSLIIHGSALLACLLLVLWPWMKHSRPPGFGWVFLAILLTAAVARFLPRRWIPSLVAGGVTASLFACVPLFNGSMAWYTVGIEFPTHNWQLLYWCRALNLGAILQENFGWEWHQKINLTDYFPFLHDWFLKANHPWMFAHVNRWPFVDSPWVFPMRYLMLTAYGISLVLCAIGMAVHYRRKSPMFFFAMVTPWVMLFTLLPQMQNRYLVWAAAFSAATAAFSLNGFMLYLLLGFVSVANTALDMMAWRPDCETSRRWLPILGPLFPDMAWAVLLIAAIWLYMSLSPGRGKRRMADGELRMENGR
jgi:hypothetical protein